MVASQIAKIGPLCGLLLAATTSRWAVLVLVPLAAAASLASFTFDVAFQTTIPEYVQGNRLETVNSALHLLRQGSNALAPAVGGVVLAAAGGHALVTIGIVLTSAALAATVAASRSGHPAAAQLQPADGARNQPRETRIGASSTVAFVVTTVVAVNIAIAGTYTLMPRYVQAVVGGGPAVFGVVQAAGAVGAILGAALFGAGITRAFAGSTVSVGIGLTALAVLLLVALPHVVTAAAGSLLIGFGSVTATLAANVLLQRRLSGAALSAAMVSKSLAVRIAVLVSSLAAGFVADEIGLGTTLVVLAVAVATVGALAASLGRLPLVRASQ